MFADHFAFAQKLREAMTCLVIGIRKEFWTGFRNVRKQLVIVGRHKCGIPTCGIPTSHAPPHPPPPNANSRAQKGQRRMLQQHASLSDFTPRPHPTFPSHSSPTPSPTPHCLYRRGTDRSVPHVAAACLPILRPACLPSTFPLPSPHLPATFLPHILPPRRHADRAASHVAAACIRFR